MNIKLVLLLCVVSFFALPICADSKHSGKKQLASDSLMCSGILGATLGSMGLLWAGLASYTLGDTTHKEYFLMKQLRDAVLRVSLPTTLIGAGLFIVGRKLDARKYELI